MFRPFRAGGFSFGSDPQGGALGWNVAAPSGRNSRSATSKLRKGGKKSRDEIGMTAQLVFSPAQVKVALPMIHRTALLSDLQKLLKKLEADLLERSQSTEIPEVGAQLRSEYEEATEAHRTAQTFDEWRSDDITQTAAAWVLSCVFVRFLEDNTLIDPPRIAGPGERLQRARDEHELYFRSHPTLTDRDYLIAVFDRLEEVPATSDVFGKHNPIRGLPNWLSGDAAGELLRFFQRIDPNTGALAHDFTDPSWDTRFLGDLYQDLSEEARKLYALLQTPVFVEEFILDRTLDPAIEEFGLARLGYETRLEPDGRLHPDDCFKMIDPACGSGHFLLGSFARLVDRWRKKDPGAKVSVLVQRALDGVHGVDVNPYAIAIARFRLLLAALKECGVRRLSDAPGFTIHVASGDSLLHGSPGGDQQTMGWAPTDHVYQPEDSQALARLLCPKSYHAVVANPPYITPKDRALNQAYRDRYSTCHMKYSLAVPFLERIVSLAVEGGFTGQITANSFMKREFGKKLIEEFFPRVDLTHVVNTDGAFIPGHGTPTVILFARNRRPVANTLRIVMGIRAEPSTPDDPSRGQVWSAIVAQLDQPGSQSEFVSVGDSPRALFHKHPWSIGGGGAAELKELIESDCSGRLGQSIDCIGFCAILGEDDAFGDPPNSQRLRLLPAIHRRPLVEGDHVRDWSADWGTEVLFPYTTEIKLVPEAVVFKWLWTLRTSLHARPDFSRKTYKDAGRTYWEYHQIPVERNQVPLSIVFAFVAPHNHFVLDRGGKVFNRSAPVIKLPLKATVDDHLALLGLLNSSTACFWLKQVSQQKQLTGGDGVRVETVAKVPYEFAGTQMEKMPLPPNWETSPLRATLTELAREADALGQRHIEFGPARAIREAIRSSRKPQTVFDEYQYERVMIRRRLILIQEEIDFVVYSMFRLTEGNLLGGDSLAESVEIEAGDRPFCIIRQHNQEGFPVPTEVSSTWPSSLRSLWERRIDETKKSSSLRLIEDPHYKRRWIGRQGLFNHTENSDPVKDACESWLLIRLESYFDFDGRMNDAGKPTARLDIALTTVGKLADVARQDAQFLQVGELYRDDPAFDVSRLVAELVEAESVPLLPILRYKPLGLRKREEWEKTWALQRQEDAIDARTKLLKDHPDHLTELNANELKKKQVGNIPVPPKYTSAEFLKGDYWRLRGKLDVPKERWVSFPHCEGPDGTLVVAWAGYDHLQLARAISAYYVDVQERLGGRDDPRLVPLLACLIELLPWLKQWHNEIDPEFGVPMGDYFEGFIQEEARQLGKTVPEIKAWEPTKRARGRRSSG